MKQVSSVVRGTALLLMFPLFPAAVRTVVLNGSYELVCNLVTLSPVRENLVPRFWRVRLDVAVVLDIRPEHPAISVVPGGTNPQT